MVFCVNLRCTSLVLTFKNMFVMFGGWKDYGISTLHYNWPMSAHASQAFSTYTSACDCTDSEHLPGGFQCAKPRHKPDFRKVRPDAQTGVKKEDVSGKPGRMVTLY